MARQKNPLPLILMAAGSLLILGAIGFLIAPGIFAGNPTPTASASGDPLADVPRVSLGDAVAAYESGSAIFLDVRDIQAYEARHIPGALSIPLEQLPDRIAELDPQAWIIPY